MTLIILLLVLLVERTGLQGSSWRVQPYLSWYFARVKMMVSEKRFEPLAWLIVLAIPAITTGLLLALIDSTLIDFIVSLIVLAVCVGNKEVRALYRKYLNAKSRDDQEAQYILANEVATFGEQSLTNSEPVNDETGDGAEQEKEQENGANLESASSAEESEIEEDVIEPQDIEQSLGGALIWHNLKYYAAPIFYFVIFGVPGVIFYTTLLYASENRTFISKLKINNEEEALMTMRQWSEWAFWLPARFVSLGFMFVGHFSAGLEAWLKLAANMSVSSKQVLTKVAIASEASHHKFEAEQMVSLAKRNMVLFLVVVALLTLYGQII